MPCCTIIAHDLSFDVPELDLFATTSDRASGKRECWVGAVGAAACCAARARRVFFTTLGDMEADDFLRSRSHDIMFAVKNIARTAHSLVVANKKFRMGSAGSEVASRKRACWVGAVGAAA